MSVKIEIDIDASKALSDTEKLKQQNQELKNSILETTKAEKEAAIARKDAAAAATLAAKEQLIAIKQQEIAIKAASAETLRMAKEQEIAIKAENSATIKATKEQEIAIKERAQQLKELTAEDKKAAQEKKRLDDEATRAAKEAADVQAFAIGKIMVAYDLFKQGLGLAIDAVKGVANAFVDSVKDAVQFEKALTDIKTIAPTTDMQALSKSLLDVSSAWGVDKITAANAQYDIMSSGITDAGEAFKVFEGAAKLAVATGAQTSETAKTITAAMNAWGISADEVGQVMDSLAITTQDGVVRMSELGPVFGQIASTAAGAGVSLQETNSALAALTLGGAPAAQAGTQLKAILVGLQKPSEELAAAFKKQTGATTQAYIEANGFAKTLEQLKIISGGSSAELFKLFGSAEAVAGILPLLNGQSQNFTKSLDKQNAAIKEGGKVTQEMADIVAQSADFQLNKLSTTISALGVDLAQAFVPAVAAGAKVLVSFVEDIRSFVSENKDSFEQAGKSVKEFIVSFGEIVQAIKQSDEFKISLAAVKDVASATATAVKESANVISSVLAESFRGSTVTIEEFKQVLGLVKLAIITNIENTIRGATVFIGIFIEQIANAVKAIDSLVKGAVNVGKALGIISVETTKAVTANDKFNQTLILSEGLFKKEKDAAKDSTIVIGAYMTQEQKLAKLKEIQAEMGKKNADETIKQNKDKADSAKKSSDEQAKAAKALADAQRAASENEANSYANKTDKLNNYRANFDSFAKGYGEVTKQIQADLKQWTDAEEAALKANTDAVNSNLQTLNENYRRNFDSFAAGDVETQANTAQEIIEIEKRKADEIIKTQKGMWDTAKGLAENAGQAVSSVFQAGLSGTTQIFNGDFLAGISTVVSGLGSALSTAIGDSLGAVGKGLGEAFATAGAIFQATIYTGITVIKEGLSTAFKAVSGGFIADIATDVTGILGSFQSSIESISKGTEALSSFKGESVFGDLSKTIDQFVKGFVKNVPEIVSSFIQNIPRVITSIARGLPEIIRTFAQQLGPIITALVKTIPEMVKALIDSLPVITEALKTELPKLLDSLIENLPALVGALLDSIIDLLPTLLPKILELVVQIILTIIDRIPDIIEAILQFIPILISKIPVIIEAILQKLPEIITSIVDGIPNIIMAIIRAIPMIILAVVNNLPLIIQSLINAIPKLVLTLVSLIINELPSIIENLINGLIEGFPKLVENLWNSIWDGLKNIGGLFGDIAKGIWNAIKSAFNAIGDFLADLFPDMWGKKGTIEKWLGWDLPWVAFAKGGIVDGKARVKGDSPLNDTVPAMLSPGEIVVPRSIVDSGMQGVSGWLQSLTGKQISGISAGAGVGMSGGKERHWNPLGWLEEKANQAGDWLSDTPIIGDIIKGAGGALKWITNAASEGLLGPIISQMPAPIPEIWEFLKKELDPKNMLNIMKDFIIHPIDATKGILQRNYQGLLKPIIRELGFAPTAFEGGISPGGLTMVSPGEMILPPMSSITRPSFNNQDSRMSSNMFNTSQLESRLISLEMTVREIGFALAKTSLRSANLLDEWNSTGIPETRTI